MHFSSWIFILACFFVLVGALPPHEVIARDIEVWEKAERSADSIRTRETQPDPPNWKHGTEPGPPTHLWKRDIDLGLSARASKREAKGGSFEWKRENEARSFYWREEIQPVKRMVKMTTPSS